MRIWPKDIWKEPKKGSLNTLNNNSLQYNKTNGANEQRPFMKFDSL